MSGAGKQAAQQAAKLGGRDKPSVYGIIAITAATAISMGVWWKRKASQDVELRSPDTREAGMPQHAPGGVEQGYGRKSAEATGMLEGDRAYQGVFPTGKIVNALEGVLPASKEGHPTKDPEYKGGQVLNGEP